ncbi:putative lipoprotein YiaD [Roseobacter fucihabitans]|uniref:Lipoprotein YiaD n=1 Tax=Roseobacter fucihabitans TaxID=1537242 RepID=A0ABZ2BXQ4_9RHOB|nr:OmpA family protein [Roseobacter litoralis]MBC6964946.1 putative lipoprotein YiaD precursor [Roseobacter litoralis]
MTFAKPLLVVAVSGTLALTACTNPNQIGANSNNPRTQQGALIGAGAGALLGALSKGDGNRGDGALVGAAIGGALGAGIGYSLDRQEADLRAQLGNDDVTITNTGDRLIVSLPQDILFATNSFTVRPDLETDIRSVAGNLQQYPQSTIQVIGHTDSDGEAGYNQQLSERRASAVGTVLLNAGVSGARIQTFGRGESQPIASNLSAQGKAQNRRVEIVILPTAS